MALVAASLYESMHSSIHYVRPVRDQGEVRFLSSLDKHSTTKQSAVQFGVNCRLESRNFSVERDDLFTWSSLLIN